jgi:hypothetical protein
MFTPFVVYLNMAKVEKSAKKHPYQNWRNDTPPTEKTCAKALKIYHRISALTLTKKADTGRYYTMAEAVQVIQFDRDYSRQYIYTLFKLGSELAGLPESKPLLRLLDQRKQLQLF